LMRRSSAEVTTPPFLLLGVLESAFGTQGCPFRQDPFFWSSFRETPADANFPLSGKSVFLIPPGEGHLEAFRVLDDPSFFFLFFFFDTGLDVLFCRIRPKDGNPSPRMPLDLYVAPFIVITFGYNPPFFPSDLIFIIFLYHRFLFSSQIKCLPPPVIFPGSPPSATAFLPREFSKKFPLDGIFPFKLRPLGISGSLRKTVHASPNQSLCRKFFQGYPL